MYNGWLMAGNKTYNYIPRCVFCVAGEDDSQETAVIHFKVNPHTPFKHTIIIAGATTRHHKSHKTITNMITHLVVNKSNAQGT